MSNTNVAIKVNLAQLISMWLGSGGGLKSFHSKEITIFYLRKSKKLKSHFIFETAFDFTNNCIGKLV